MYLIYDKNYIFLYKKFVDMKNSITFALESRNGAVVARWAHNPEVVGSNPASATKFKEIAFAISLFFLYLLPLSHEL